MEKQVSDIIEQYQQDEPALIAALEQLGNESGDGVYREALAHLVGKSFPEARARQYWEAALEHRQKILVGDRIDSSLRPALLDYLHQEVGELTDPRIVEASDLANIRTASVTDGLTGLYNQTYFKEFVSKFCNQRRRNESASNFALLLLDLDHFKQYNDRCGHLAGDRALKQVAKILGHCTRKGDIVARYGGEEFAILLNPATRDQAYMVADRIRKVIDKASFQGQHLLDRQNLTISIGLAFNDGKNDTVETILQRADEELYRAKLFRNAISPHHSDHRTSARIRKQSLVEIAPFDDNSFVPAMSYDVSPCGIAIDCDRSFPEGTPIKLRFRHPYWPSNRQVVASIRHIDEDPASGLYRLGLKFNPEQALSSVGATMRNSA